MTAELLAAWAAFAAAVFAAVGLFFSGFQTRQETASRDFDTLRTMFSQLSDLEDELSAAVRNGDDTQWQSTCVKILNWIEMLVVALDRKLIGPTSREFGKELAIDVLAMMEQGNALAHLRGRITGRAYNHTSGFLKRNGSAIRERVQEMVAQDAKREPGGEIAS